MEYPQNGPFHNRSDVIILSRTGVSEMVDDDDTWQLQHFKRKYRHFLQEMLTFVNRSVDDDDVCGRFIFQ